MRASVDEGASYFFLSEGLVFFRVDHCFQDDALAGEDIANGGAFLFI